MYFKKYLGQRHKIFRKYQLITKATNSKDAFSRLKSNFNLKNMIFLTTFVNLIDIRLTAEKN